MLEDSLKTRTFPNKPFMDNYKVTEYLGGGSQGKVYRVQENGTNQTYILKKITTPSHPTEIDEENNHREIQAYKRFDHPNLPTLLNYYCEEDKEYQEQTHYMLMDDWNGQTLTEYWKDNGPLTATQLQSVETQVLDALAHAHSLEVEHRDIKPDNILITDDGTIQLIDWGVARFNGQETRIGTVGAVGTPGYMSPEQYDSEYQRGPLSDIYSLYSTLIATARGRDVQVWDSPKMLKDMIDNLDHLPIETRDRWKKSLSIDPNKRGWKLIDGKYEFNQETALVPAKQQDEDDILILAAIKHELGFFSQIDENVQGQKQLLGFYQKANNVELTQKQSVGIGVQIADNVKKDQIQCVGLAFQKAKEISNDQGQYFGLALQLAGKVKRQDQEFGGAIQISNNSDNQEQFMGVSIQLADEVSNQLNFFGATVQLANIVYEEQTQVFGFGVRYAKKAKCQTTFFGIGTNIAKEVSNDQTFIGISANLAQKVDGTQIGLANIVTKESRGNQIGLINYSNDDQTRQIGLINFRRGKHWWNPEISFFYRSPKKQIKKLPEPKN